MKAIFTGWAIGNGRAFICFSPRNPDNVCCLFVENCPDQVPLSSAYNDKAVFILRIEDILSLAGFYFSSDLNKFLGNGIGDEKFKRIYWSSASLFFLCLVGNELAIGLNIISALWRTFVTSKTIGSQVATCMTTVLKTSQTPSSINIHVSMEWEAALTNSLANAILRSL